MAIEFLTKGLETGQKGRKLELRLHLSLLHLSRGAGFKNFQEAFLFQGSKK